MPNAALSVDTRIKAVLVTTDFTKASEKPLRRALAIAHHYEAKFYLAHVVTAVRLCHRGTASIARDRRCHQRCPGVGAESGRERLSQRIVPRVYCSPGRRDLQTTRVGNTISFANHFGAKLILLHVAAIAPIPEGLHWSGTTTDIRKMQEEAGRTAVERLKELVSQNIELNTPPEFIVNFGRPSEKIL
jgi:hypothetical protein